MLNQENREKLVLLVNSGKDTYTDIKRAIPDLTDSELRIASLPMRIVDLSERVLSLDHIPSGDKDRYEFATNDTFSLSQYGVDLLYQVQKERRQEELAIKSLATAEKSLTVERMALKEARISKYCSIIAAISAIISILTAVL